VILRKLSAYQVQEWYAFFWLGGSIREQAMDARFAALNSLVWNRTSGPKGELMSTQDFMPDWTGARARKREKRRKAIALAKVQIAAHQTSPEVKRLREESYKKDKT